VPVSRRQPVQLAVRHPQRGVGHPGRVTGPGFLPAVSKDGLLRRINAYLMRWARRKYKRLRPFRKARRWLHELTARQPRMFAHWAWMNEF
jgi:hypothetical protein